MNHAMMGDTIRWRLNCSMRFLDAQKCAGIAT